VRSIAAPYRRAGIAVLLVIAPPDRTTAYLAAAGAALAAGLTVRFARRRADPTL
jgi:hypothetical protein